MRSISNFLRALKRFVDKEEELMSECVIDDLMLVEGSKGSKGIKRYFNYFINLKIGLYIFKEVYFSFLNEKK